jgi:hypothetical protein
MGEFSCKDNVSGRVVYDGEASGCCARINLDPQFSDLGILDRNLQDDREWVPLENGCFSSGEQQACITRVNGIQWLFVGVYNENVTHVFVPLRTSGCPGNGGLDNVSSGLLSAALA